ncbi:MAG TPA: PilT/PilU family type 4a pilus ATPase [Dissulfurispiraceae bacterium]
MSSLPDLLKLMIERKASDLHITTGSPPKLRIIDKLVPVEDFSPLSPEDTQAFCYSVLSDMQKSKLEERSEVDLSFGIKGLSRFRANIFMQRGAVAGAFRAIPFDIKSFKELGIPDVVEEFIKKPHGLILVTGPSGSGKSTTLASMIDRINSEREAHIITIEDPIEFLHSHKKGIVNQREVASDTPSFKQALGSIVRQDPDVVFIGEMHDLDTVQAAISIAETGHLTLATLHTNSAIQTISRVIDIFPPHHQEQIRVQLSLVLEGIVSQRLISTQDGGGRVLALEILVPTPAIKSLIRENRLQQIYAVMQAGQARSGMRTMNQSLYELYCKGLISSDDSIHSSSMPEEMLQVLAKGHAQKA